MAYRLSIGGKVVGEFQTWKGCWESIDWAYDQFPDRYSGGLRYRVKDLDTGKTVRAAMAGGIWDACCEDPRAFGMYMRIVGWR